jgi:serine/threonine-protein kinase
VHRDLKPSNLFLTRRSDGSPLIKVLDFGISKALTDGPAGEPSGSLTATSAVMGSPLYMSPEQVRNARQVDGRTDVWSLGVILYELLTGSPVFQADTVPGICAAIVADEPPLLRSSRKDGPPELEAVVSRCLEKPVGKRFQSVAELMLALRVFAPASSRGPVRLSMVQTMPEAGSSSRSPGPPLESGLSRRGGRVVVSVSPESAALDRPESHKGGPIASGGAVALSSQASAARSESRYRLALMAGGIVFIGVAAGWTLASLRQERAGPQPAPVASVISGDRFEKRESFVLLIESEPQGASVLEGRQRLGATPAWISVDNEAARTSPRKLSIEREGFLPYSIVQGPSDHDVHVVAVLESRASGSTVPDTPASRQAGAPAPRPFKAKLATPAPVAPGEPYAVSSASRPTGVPGVPAAPASSDIRPQR